MAQAPKALYKKSKDARLRTGAGGVVARFSKNQIRIALIRDRGDHLYVLPKGGVEAGETLQQAAMREIREEAGFRKLKFLGDLGIGRRMAGRKNIWQTTHYFLFLTSQLKGKPTDRRDWEVNWFDIDKLPELYWHEQERMLHRQIKKIIRLVKSARGKL